jgi:GNAT superfamily N-acetyltransferase
MIDIRPIEPGDLDGFLALLQAKADFDGARAALLATTDNLREELFSANPRCFAIVAIEGDTIIGMATYFATYSSFIMKPGIWLDDLYVKESHRKNGVGIAILRWICKLATKKGAARVDWIVADTNVNGQGFYRHLGAEIIDAVRLARFDERAIQTLAAL